MLEDKNSFQVKGIDHIGIVPNYDSGLFILLKEILGFDVSPVENILDQKTQVQKLSSSASSEISYVTSIELLSPINNEGVIRKYLDKNKSGIHHIAIQVTNIERVIKILINKNIKMINNKPKTGHNNCKIAFIHPRATSGILVELVERNETT